MYCVQAAVNMKTTRVHIAFSVHQIFLSIATPLQQSPKVQKTLVSSHWAMDCSLFSVHSLGNKGGGICYLVLGCSIWHGDGCQFVLSIFVITDHIVSSVFHNLM